MEDQITPVNNSSELSFASTSSDAWDARQSEALSPSSGVCCGFCQSISEVNTLRSPVNDFKENSIKLLTEVKDLRNSLSEHRPFWEKLESEFGYLRTEIQALSAIYKNPTLRDVCTCLERFFTFEVFGDTAELEERHVFILLDDEQEDQLKTQMKLCGWSHKLFDIMTRFSSKANSVLSSPPTVLQVEAVIMNDSDDQETKDCKEQFVSALHRYGVVQKDGTLDLTVRPAFLKSVVNAHPAKLT